MRVDPRHLPPTTAPSAPARAAGAVSAFSLGGDPVDASGARPAAGGPVAASPLATADALLVLQGGGDLGRERRQRSAKRGHELLDALDRLKAALLVGRVSTADLAAIAGRLSERTEASGDPRLDDLVAHIRLRAEVEMAKLATRDGRSA